MFVCWYFMGDYAICNDTCRWEFGGKVVLVCVGQGILRCRLCFRDGN